jgi:hypothetical protein
MKEDEMGGACSQNGESRMHIGYWWESQKRPLGRRRRRWVNIKMDLREREDGTIWIGLIWLRLGTSAGLL